MEKCNPSKPKNVFHFLKVVDYGIFGVKLPLLFWEHLQLGCFAPSFKEKKALGVSPLKKLVVSCYSGMTIPSFLKTDWI